jgi:ABC-type transport system substrate-binding protein
MTNGWILGILVLICLLVVACSAAATATPTAAPTSTPTATPPQQSASTIQPTPTPAPQATSAPTKTTNARDKAIVVTEAEPASVGTWSEGCSGEIQSMGCQELTQDYIGWIDTKTLEPVLLSGFTKYQQIAPNRWRYTLREGVKFHNGEPWNAAAAKLGLDWNGVGSNSGNSLGYTGVTTGEVVDELTVDVACENSCPIFPRTGIFTEFVAPQ